MTLRNAVALHIRRHLGAHKFETLTGAYDFVGSGDSLTFRLPKTVNGINAVTIRLIDDDLCVVTFVRRMHFGTVTKVVHSFDRVPIDKLRPLFSETTGIEVAID